MRLRRRAGVVCLATAAAAAALLQAQAVITTVAGTDWVFPRGSVPAIGAPIGLPTCLTLEPSSGRPIVLDYLNHMVLRLNEDGRLAPYAGNGLGGFSGDNGAAINASLLYPRTCTMDRAGNLYIADSEGRALRKVSPQGVITTIFGTGRRTPADGVPVAEAQFQSVISLAVLPDGEIALADDALGRIFRISVNGVLTRVAGNGPCRSEGDGGPARDANICLPDHLAADAQGNLYFSDVTNTQATPRTRRVRRIAADGGSIAAFAGNGASGRVQNGAKATDSPMQPYAIAAHPRLGVLISSGIAATQPEDEITDIARVTAEGLLETIPAPALSRTLVTELAATPDGAIYATSSLPGRVYRIRQGADAELVAGGGAFHFGGDGGAATLALLNLPLGLAVDSSNNLFIADVANNRVRRMDASGVIHTVAGNGQRLLSPPAPETPATENPLLQPFFTAVGPDDRLYFSSSFGVHRLNDDGSQTAEPYGAVNPGGLAFATDGSLLFADRGRGRLLRGRPSQSAEMYEIETLIPRQTGGAALITPFDLAYDAAGNLYISEWGAHRVLRIDPNGAITVFAGTGRSSSQPIPAGPRAATSVPVTQPSGLAVDSQGNLLIRSYGHLSRVTPSGQLEVIAGIGPSNLGSVVYGDGGPAMAAALGATGDVAVDSLGNIFLSEVDNHRVRKILAAPPAFHVSADKLALSAVSGGAPTPGLAVTAAAEVPGVAFQIAARTADGTPWLRVSTTAGVTPRLVHVSADPANLAPGTYTGTLEFQAPLARPSSFTVSVSLTVGPAQPPSLLVDKNSLTFTYPRTASTRTQTLLLTNPGSGPVSVEAIAPPSSFLRVSPASGVVTPAQPLQLSVSADPTRRGPGLYRATLLLRGAGATRSVDVTMTISDREQAILLSQTGLSFQAVAQGGVVPPQSFAVLNPGNGLLRWRIRTSTLAGGPGWLTVSDAAGATDAATTGAVPSIDVRINQEGLAPGVYHGLVTVESDEAANSPHVLPVMLEVLPPEARPASVVQPAELVFTGVEGQNLGSQELTVFNLAREPIAYRSSAPVFAPGQPLQYAPIDALVHPGEPQRIVVQPQAQLLKPGTHRSELALQFADGTVRRVDVTVVIRPKETEAGRAAAGCAPKRLIPSLRSLGQAASVPAGWPAGVVVDVTDDCGTALEEGIVALSLSNGDPPVVLQSLNNGRWHGTWISRAGQTGPVTVRVVAENPKAELRGEQESTADLRAAELPPSLAEEGIALAPLSPGGVLTLSGARFTVNQSLTAPAADAALPDRLGDTEVLVAGRRLPLFAAAEDRIQAILPMNVNPNTRHQVLVRRGLTYSRAVPVNVAASNPDILRNPEDGAARALARVVREGVEPFWNTAANPIRPGDRVLLHCTGLGAVEDASFAAGSRTPDPGPRATATPVTVRVGGVAVPAAETRLVPGQIGRYQVTFTMPAGAATGTNVEVTVEAQGLISGPAALSIR